MRTLVLVLCSIVLLASYINLCRVADDATMYQTFLIVSMLTLIHASNKDK